MFSTQSLQKQGLTPKHRLRQLVAGGDLRRSGVNWEEETMRIASIAASLALAAGLIASSFTTPSLAASDNPVTTTAPAQLKKKVARPLKPTWEQCFDMSVNRGFNHDSEEWHQSIVDCMDGKI